MSSISFKWLNLCKHQFKQIIFVFCSKASFRNYIIYTVLLHFSGSCLTKLCNIRLSVSQTCGSSCTFAHCPGNATLALRLHPCCAPNTLTYLLSGRAACWELWRWCVVLVAERAAARPFSPPHTSHTQHTYTQRANHFNCRLQILRPSTIPIQQINPLAGPAFG